MHYTKQKLIQLIHIAKHQLKLDEETYRMILMNQTCKVSCKAMTVAELMIVLEKLKKAGFKVKQTLNKSPSSKEAIVKHTIALKIRAEWIQMHKQGIVKDGSETALNTFVRNIINPILKEQGSNRIILNVQSLDYQNGTIVLERLKKWKKRVIKIKKEENYNEQR